MLFCLCSDSARVANYLYHFAGLWRRHCLYIWEGVFWNFWFDGDELGVKGVFERFYWGLVSVVFCFTYIFFRTFYGTMMISQNSIDLCWCGTCFWLGHTNNITHQAPIIKHHTSNIFYQISLNKYHSSNIIHPPAITALYFFNGVPWIVLSAWHWRRHLGVQPMQNITVTFVKVVCFAGLFALEHQVILLCTIIFA